MATRRYRRRTLGNKISDVDKRLKYLERRPARSTLRDFIVQTSKIQDRSVTIEKLSEELISDQDDVDAQLEAIEEEQKVLEDNINTVEGLAQSSANYKRATDPTTVKSISQVETNDGVVTFTTSTAHEFLPTNAVKVQGFSGAFIKFNGTYAVKTVPTSTTFTITKNTGLANDIYAGGGTVAISPSYGDTWWDTNSDNEPKTWNGSTWDSVRDETISVAQDAADAAQLSADEKNRIYRQSTVPTTGPFAEGDLWFDTDDDNKFYRYASGAFSAFTLGDNALASLSANKITAGTIDASIITVSNLDAGNITTGTLTGRTVRTSTSGRRVEVSAADNALTFYNNLNTLVAQITPGNSAAPNDYGFTLLSGNDPNYAGSDSYIEIFPEQLGIYSDQSVYVSSPVGVDIVGPDTRFYGGSAVYAGTSPSSPNALDVDGFLFRNIYVPSTSNQSPTGGTNGNIWLEW